MAADQGNQDTLPWSWRYVAACIVLPLLSGGLNGFLFSGYSLYFRKMGWELWIVSVASGTACLGRIVFQQLQLCLGIWVAAPMTFVHAIFAILVLIYPDQLWVVACQPVVILSFDTLVTTEAITFAMFSKSEKMAKQAATTLLCAYTVSYASSATYGGIIYDVYSWTGIAVYHVASAMLNLGVLVIMPPIWNSWAKFRKGGGTEAGVEVQVARERINSAASDDWALQGCADSAPSISLEDLNECVAKERAEINEVEIVSCPAEGAKAKSQKGGKPCEESSKSKSKIPPHLLLPALLIYLHGFANFLSYSTVWSTYAIFFKEHHGWDSATWAGIAQTSGDLLAAAAMALTPKSTAQNEHSKAATGIRRLLPAMVRPPYNISWLLLFWVVLNLGITHPLLPVSIAAQMLMGTVYTYCIKANTDLNLFFSSGSSDLFLALQVGTRGAESLGATFGSFMSLQLYAFVHPTAPFLASAAGSFIALIVFTISFFLRLGCPQSLETAEEARCRRLNISRSASWGETR